MKIKNKDGKISLVYQARLNNHGKTFIDSLPNDLKDAVYFVNQDYLLLEGRKYNIKLEQDDLLLYNPYAPNKLEVIKNDDIDEYKIIEDDKQINERFEDVITDIKENFESGQRLSINDIGDLANESDSIEVQNIVNELIIADVVKFLETDHDFSSNNKNIEVL